MDEQALTWLRQQIEGDLAHWRQRVAVFCGRHELAGTGPVGGYGDPRNRLADAEARQAILSEHYILFSDDQNEAYEEFCVYRFPSHGWDFGCVTCHYYAQGAVRNYGYCRTVKALASAYRHWPGYAEHWPAAAATPG